MTDAEQRLLAGNPYNPWDLTEPLELDDDELLLAQQWVDAALDCLYAGDNRDVG